MDFIDLKTQYQNYRSEIDPLLSDIMANARFIMGPELKAFETQAAEYIGSSYAIGCSSGTDALLLALMAIDIQPGDEVITTPFTFIATVEVISLLKAKPVFVDIDEKNYNIDIDQLESKITDKTKAFIPVSLYGQCPDMNKINQIAEKHKITVIEDAAQSFGAIYKGRKSCNLSKIGATSFFPSKPLGGYGDGGMVFTSDDALADKMKQLLNHGQNARYQHKYVGINGRLDNIQAAVLSVKLKHFEAEAIKRFSIGRKYNDLLKDTDVIIPMVEPYTDRHVFAQYSIRVKNRDKVVGFLKEKQIPTAIHYPVPIHLQEAYSYLGNKKGSFPVSENISNEIMSLPMHPLLTEDAQKFITDQIKAIV